MSDTAQVTGLVVRPGDVWRTAWCSTPECLADRVKTEPLVPVEVVEGGYAIAAR